MLEPLKVLYGPNVEPDQHVEDVPLVHVDRDQGLELYPLHLLEVLGRLTDEGVEEVEELVVGLLHDLTVGSRLDKSCFGVASPDHLDSEDSNLKLLLLTIINFISIILIQNYTDFIVFMN